jgi:hypothetical protein
MAQRGGRYYAIRTEPETYSRPAFQEQRIQQLEQEIAVLKQRNSELVACLDQAVSYMHRLKPRISAQIVAEIERLKPKATKPQLDVCEEIPFSDSWRK